MRIQNKQKFHPVGQGLFYSSLFNFNNISANVIFDCGSEKFELIKEEIDNFPIKDIDILIISHLHYDHVSGLDYLLNKLKINNKKIDTVILPYLCLKERILLQCVNFNKTKPDDEWYNDFLSNPYSFIDKKKIIKKIIIINGDSENDDYSVQIPDKFPDLNDNSTDEKTINIELEDVSKEIKNIISKEENIKINGNLMLKKDRGYITISNMYFSFFNYKITNNKKISLFNDHIEDFRNSDTKSVLDSLSDQEKRTLIKKSYEILRKDLNITSLAVFHGLILPPSQQLRNFHITIHGLSSSPQNLFYDLLCCNCDSVITEYYHHRYGKHSKHEFYFDYICDCNRHCNCLRMIGTLLLGDIKLDYKHKTRKEFFTHFKNLLPLVRLVQLSHHGAENGWNNDLIQKLHQNSIYIASHGESNKYRHPHKKVVMELSKNNRKFISVTEKNEYYNCFRIFTK